MMMMIGMSFIAYFTHFVLSFLEFDLRRRPFSGFLRRSSAVLHHGLNLEEEIRKKWALKYDLAHVVP